MRSVGRVLCSVPVLSLAVLSDTAINSGTTQALLERCLSVWSPSLRTKRHFLWTQRILYFIPQCVWEYILHHWIVCIERSKSQTNNSIFYRKVECNLCTTHEYLVTKIETKFFYLIYKFLILLYSLCRLRLRLCRRHKSLDFEHHFQTWRTVVNNYWHSIGNG